MQADELVTEIYTIVTRLSGQEMNTLSGDTLSRLAVKLAAYKAALGEHVSTAKRQMYDSEAIYHRTRAEAYKRLREDGKGATDSDELKRLEAHDAWISWNEAREQCDRVTQLSMDCHDLIDGIKSRLIVLQTERTENAIY